MFFTTTVFLLHSSTASNNKTSKDHKASLKTVKAWEKEFSFTFEYDLTGSNGTRLRCSICKRWENRINLVKGFTLNWIRPGTHSIKKDGIKSYCRSAQHIEANRLDQRSKMGAQPYVESIVKNSPIGRGLRKMCEKDKASLRVKFNSVYYLAKKERPFSDYPDLLVLQTKNQIQGIGKSYLTARAAGNL